MYSKVHSGLCLVCFILYVRPPHVRDRHLREGVKIHIKLKFYKLELLGKLVFKIVTELGLVGGLD